MNDEIPVDPIATLLSNQFGTMHVWHPHFLGEDPDALLVFCWLLAALFALAFLCRWSLYAGTRISGLWRLERGTQYRETVSMVIAFGAGFVVGEMFLHNALLSGLVGGFFMVISTGAVLEAMVINARDTRHIEKRALQAMRKESAKGQQTAR